MRGPRVAIWGCFDRGEYADLAAARIVETGLRAALHGSEITFYAPDHPPSDGLDLGRPIWALGTLEAAPRRAIAQRQDSIIVFPVPPPDSPTSSLLLNGLGADLEELCPVVRLSEHDLLGLAALAAGSFPSQLLARRRDNLRAMNWYPGLEKPVVVERNVLNVEPLVQFLRAHGTPVVALNQGQGFPWVHELAGDVAVDDVTAAIADARCFIGWSPFLVAVAESFKVDAVALDESENPVETLDRVLSGERLGARSHRACAEALIERLAATARAAWAERVENRMAPATTADELAAELQEAEEQIAVLTRAYAARGERLLRERQRFAEIIDAFERERGRSALDAIEAESLRARIEILDGELAAANWEVSQLRSELEAARSLDRLEHGQQRFG